MSRPASISLRAITISSEPVQLRRTIEKDRAQAEEGPKTQPAATLTEGVLEAAARVNDLMPEMMNSMNSLKAHMDRISDVTNAHPAPAGGDPKALLIWSKTLADATDADARSLRNDVATISAGWGELYAASRSYVDLLTSLPDGEQKNHHARGEGVSLHSTKYYPPAQRVVFYAARTARHGLKSLNQRAAAAHSAQPPPVCKLLR